MLKTYMIIKDQNDKDINILDLSNIKDINISSDHIFISDVDVDVINYENIKTCYFIEYQLFDKNSKWKEVLVIIENNKITLVDYKSFWYNNKFNHPFIREFVEQFCKWYESVDGEKDE